MHVELVSESRKIGRIYYRLGTRFLEQKVEILEHVANREFLGSTRRLPEFLTVRSTLLS